MQPVGKVLIIVGLILVIGGILISKGYTGFFTWFGNLPGDIRYEKGNTRVYIPLVSMLLLSVIGSLVMWVLNKLR